MSVTIHKNDSMKTIREAIQKMTKRKKRKTIQLDRFFGKINFGSDGLDYQKKIRDEWK